MLEQVDNVKKIWADVIKQAPMTSNAIVPTTKQWGGGGIPDRGVRQ